MSVVALIGGSGLSEFEGLSIEEQRLVETPFGPPSSALLLGKIGRREVVFLARHGESHTIPPHMINYRANLWALKEVGATEVVAVAAVGGVDRTLMSGDLVVPDQLIDYTWGRQHTFFDRLDGVIDHVDFTSPYNQEMRQRLIRSAQHLGERVVETGCYAATQGPRLESIAEIDRIERDGGTLVGMTGMPEAGLARERDLPYATLALVVNPAAGRDLGLIDIEMMKRVMREGMSRVRCVLSSYLNPQ